MEAASVINSTTAPTNHPHELVLCRCGGRPTCFLCVGSGLIGKNLVETLDLAVDALKDALDIFEGDADDVVLEWRARARAVVAKAEGRS
jgi:hypothetical protein